MIGKSSRSVVSVSLETPQISEGKPRENSTKVWITKSGKCLAANNNSQVPSHTLRNIVRVLEAGSEEITNAWTDYFGEIHFFI